MLKKYFKAIAKFRKLKTCAILWNKKDKATFNLRANMQGATGSAYIGSIGTMERMLMKKRLKFLRQFYNNHLRTLYRATISKLQNLHI